MNENFVGSYFMYNQYSFTLIFYSLGIETTFKNQLYPVIIATTHVDEFNYIEEVDNGIKFGASVP